MASHPPRQRGLGDRVGAQRLALTGQRPRRVLVALETAGDEVLVEAGLVTREQRGRWAYYRVVEATLATLAAVLDPR